jgi:hypothetical protein
MLGHGTAGEENCDKHHFCDSADVAHSRCNPHNILIAHDNRSQSCIDQVHKGEAEVGIGKPIVAIEFSCISQICHISHQY